MARWRLLNAHYLRVPGNQWEYKETDRSSGKQIRRAFDIPQLLNPNDPSDWNYKNGDEGEIIVANRESDDHTRDIIFLGEPTPDMEPLDDEARKISAGFADKWKYQADPLSPSYSQSLVDGFHKEMEAVQAKQAAMPSADVAALTAAVTQMAQMQATMMEALTKTARRA